MSRPRESVQRLSSRIKEIWLSVLSWMHWSQRRRMREQHQMREQMRVLLLQQEVRLRERQDRLLIQQQDSLHSLLLEALRPVALAMQRQDSLAERRQDSLQELLVEVLTSLQPSAEAQISQQLGQPLQMSSSRSWAS